MHNIGENMDSLKKKKVVQFICFKVMDMMDKYNDDKGTAMCLSVCTKQV